MSILRNNIQRELRVIFSREVIISGGLGEEVEVVVHQGKVDIMNQKKRRLFRIPLI